MVRIPLRCRVPNRVLVGGCDAAGIRRRGRMGRGPLGDTRRSWPGHRSRLKRQSRCRRMPPPVRPVSRRPLGAGWASRTPGPRTPRLPPREGAPGYAPLADVAEPSQATTVFGAHRMGHCVRPGRASSSVAGGRRQSPPDAELHHLGWLPRPTGRCCGRLAPASSMPAFGRRRVSCRDHDQAHQLPCLASSSSACVVRAGGSVSKPSSPVALVRAITACRDGARQPAASARPVCVVSAGGPGTRGP